jgi:RimJ/RimL family protein N-acetyltransferase
MTAAGALPTPAEAIAGFRGEIRSPRLLLRPVVEADVPDIFALFNDWEVVRWLATPSWPMTEEAIRAHVQGCEADKAIGHELFLVAMLDETAIGALSWRLNRGLSFVGFWLGRAHWGHGYTSEAAAALCDHIFARTDAPAIHSGAFEGNTASMRVQTKLGFVQIGTSVHTCRPRGADVTHLDTKLTRAARRAAAAKADT